MPYKRVGRKVLHKRGGAWKVKQVCSSPESAKRALRLLQGVEHGWEPTGGKTTRK